MVAIKAIQPRHYPIFTYKEKPIQVVQNFKYLGINAPSTNRLNVCYEPRLQAGCNSYYMFKNQCNQSDTEEWKTGLMFNAMVVQVLSYGVEVQGGTISLGAWNENSKFSLM